MLWISWLVVYKSLFFTTNNNTENMYLDCKGRISSLLNKCLQESLLLDTWVWERWSKYESERIPFPGNSEL